MKESIIRPRMPFARQPLKDGARVGLDERRFSGDPGTTLLGKTKVQYRH